MATKRKPAPRQGDRRRNPEGGTRSGPRRAGEAQPNRRIRRQHSTAPAPGRETRPRSKPQNSAATRPEPRPGTRPAPPKNTKQAKARAKARKAKAPKVVRVPLRERLITRLASVDLRPRTLAAKVPFVVLIIGALGIGLGITLWLSTDAAERSYQLGNIREHNRVLLQQKEALERDVLTAESAPALAEAARELGMIPTRDTAHLVQDPVGNWVVVGVPKPAEGVSPPPLNTKLPDDRPAPVEVPVRLPAAGPKPPTRHLPDATVPPVGVPGAPLTVPGLPGSPLLGPPPGPALDTLPAALPPGSAVPPGSVLPPAAVLPPEVVLPPETVLPPATTLPPAATLPPQPALAPEALAVPGVPTLPGAAR
ncbi:hypothetical protein K6T79_07945 [Mycolicibacter sp. MYC098]|uniref:FHA domain-containing protein n=2 Tax=[Mycobacterium] crassicus TaxID=2872309 RepID=A0ABU5XFD3_9MYCO|nr:hypothetical protein [Mycolicibacter sp. MYC098]MEB3020974.1 hypothetical protein [Mycolicibacter sp. MYC098]